MKKDILALILSIAAITIVVIEILIPGTLIPINPGTSCTDAICKDSITVRSTQFILSPNSLQQASAPCQANEKVTGGGYQIIDDSKLFVWKNRPAANASAWDFAASNYGPDPRSGTVYAVCIKVE